MTGRTLRGRRDDSRPRLLRRDGGNDGTRVDRRSSSSIRSKGSTTSVDSRPATARSLARCGPPPLPRLSDLGVLYSLQFPHEL